MRPAVLTEHERDLPLITTPRPEPPAIAGTVMSITTYRRNGEGVATPVWFVPEGGRFLVMTDEHSGKVKRIRRDPFVRIAACTARGRLKTEPIPAYAEVLPASETERVKRLIARRYRVALLFVRPIRWLQAAFRPGEREETVILAITPVPLSRAEAA